MAPTSKALPASQKNSTTKRSVEPVEKSLPVVVHKSRNAALDGSRIHPSTERALIIRDKAGAPIVPGKISGQEKLALLADELMTTAIMPRLDMEELLRIADSQLWLHLSEISNLKDPLFFYDDIMATIESRFESLPNKDGRKPDFVYGSRWIASVIGSRVHNLYLLAACWKVVKNVVKELKAMHLDASAVHEQLARNIKLRDKYLLLYDVVTTLARSGQQRIANITAATPHYAGYFHLRNVTAGTIAEAEEQLEFNRQNSDLRQLRQAHKSFIDAIVLEIALPNSQYPPHILMTLLREAVDECKKEEVRFSQVLWDAIGDFSMTVRALDMIESPLLNEQGDAWLRNSVLSRDYIELLKMQDLSQHVIEDTSSWSACFDRLIDTKDKACLDLLWKTINESYRKFTGKHIEGLWSLQKEIMRTPQWSSTLNADLESDSEDLDRALVVRPTAESKVTKGVDRLRLTSGTRSDDEDDEIPDLMSLSDFSDEDNVDGSAQPDDNSDDYESDYDESDDEMYQDDLREAQDQILDMLLDPDPEFLEFEKKSSNPFVKMFAALRDRFIVANPTLRLDEQSRRPHRYAFHATAQTVRTTVAHPTEPTRRREVTVEDVEDEDGAHPSKKKKKKRKKKKKAPQDQELAEELDELEDEETRDLSADSPAAPARPVTPNRPIPPVKPVESPQSRISSPGQASSPKKPKPASNKPNKPLEEFSYSQISLPSPETAQSARSYLQAENLVSEKTKIKSRPAFASKFLAGLGEDKEKKKGKDNDDREVGSKTGSFFNKIKIKKFNLSKKAGELMHRLIGSADGKTHAKKTMKWDDFVKVMRMMGFTYEPGTAGSSVRFDPPHPGDPSVTFHKPHPDSTLQRHHLRDFGKKLTKTYGWSEDMFSTFGIEEDEAY